jgi:hypothetical protein
MAVLSAQKTYKNLLKKGFSDAPNKSDDHKWIELFYENQLILHTKISHGAKDLDNYLIKQMSFQCKLDKNQFLDLARCPMSQDEYVEILL